MTTATRDLARLTLGTAPDSWGVWFANDPQQVGWRQYLDEVANAGYVWTELGPQGFLPQDPQQLRDELDQRGLKVCGGTVFAGLHKGKEALAKAIKEFSQEAKLLTEVGAKYLIQLPEQYTDMHTGAVLESADMDPEQWSNLIVGHQRVGSGALRGVRRRAGVPSARRHPRRHPGPDRGVPQGHRPAVRQPLPGHRSHRVLRRGQPADHRTRPGADHLSCTSSWWTR